MMLTKGGKRRKISPFTSWVREKEKVRELNKILHPKGKLTKIDR